MKDDSETVLVIGGTNDGAHIKRPEHSIIQMLAKREGFDSVFPDIREVEIKTEIYERMFFHGNNQRFEVFVLSGMSPDMDLAKLLEGYKK